MNNCITTIVSDLHTNSTVGICPPNIQLDDGGTYRQSKIQKWFWRNWLDTWQKYKDIKARENLPLVLIVNGDAGDGDHHDTPQIITRNPTTQLRIAVDTLKPALDVADVIIIIRGTEVHVGKNAWIEEKLAEDIGAFPCNDEMHSWWHLYAEFGGVTFDVKHHPESGSMRPWTAGGEANRIAAILTYNYALSGMRPPDVAFRAHKHKFLDSGTTHPTRVFATPAWQFSTAFVHRIGAGGDPPRCGSVYLICRDGKYVPDVIDYQVKRSKPVPVKVMLDETKK